MQLLTKYLRTTIILNRYIDNSIAIIIAIYFINNNFNTKIFSFLQIEEKLINKS